MSDRPVRRWIGLFFFVLVVSLLVSPASFLLSMAAFTGKAHEIVENADGTPVVIIGAGNSGNQWHLHEADGRAVARTLVETGAAEAVTDATLREMFSTLEARALAGDADAAAVIVRIAELQRRPPEDE